MTPSIHHAGEPHGNELRELLVRVEPKALRTFTPTQAVIQASAGVFHWTPEGRRLYDFTSGVLVSNLGHNPASWMRRFGKYMGWPPSLGAEEYFTALPFTAYNAATPVETSASSRLLKSLRGQSGGSRMERVMWAASGSEAIQKALWVGQARDRSRPMILATRFGFHGKKGLANAVTGSETDSERDPRVRFISIPMAECRDVSLRDAAFDPAPYQKELDALLHQFGGKIGTLITEPYLGGGGSYHPPKAYLQLLDRFCKANDIVFVLDEVQANFGRTGNLFAFTTYGLEPDIVVLGKGLGNGVPVAAAVGRADLFAALDYGEASDTWSANPLCCAAVLATLDEFEARDVIGAMKASSRIIEDGLVRLKKFPQISAIRGEKDGMVWGIEFQDHAGKTAAEWANALVLACYRGDGKDGIHLL
ncbi:MAG TPA: aminotransferase class III-fold pyridoxal phosphate-dependent enzyme, partial [Urbifossiella sp.]|nr:aminotransferase class III-fold pyridoxal phosphate-dependent enzyme [Urbifossiella sp.]